MNELVKQRMIFFNSASRITGEIYDLVTILPSDIFHWDQSHWGELELISFTSKSSYYNIDALRNNSFDLVEGETTTTVTLTEGNYNVLELATEIQTQLNTASTNYTWGVSYNTKTNKFSYSYTLTGTPQSPISFNFSLESNKILGFSSDVTFSTSPTVSTNMISIGNLETMLIYCNWVNSSMHLDSSISSHHNTSQVLAEIPVIGSSFFGTIYYESTNHLFSMKLPDSSNTNTLQIFMKDKEGNPVRLQEDYSMVFRLNVYKKENMNTSLDKLVKLLTINSLTKSPSTQTNKK